ncbi:MAG: beta-lactamase family protein [Kangiellaceae bacterium]|nr:beta-lactamase family protein [Kangiellaceae bacterium]MCW8997549.1 beta-lactamase family protein [Kangiellaceae bacterium]
MKLLPFAVGLAFASSFVSASSFSQKVDSLFDSVDKNTMPGCSVGVIEKGKLIHKRGYGSANLELNIPLDGSHVHRTGSVSKQFTALAVLLLVEEGKIALTDDIRKHLPDLRDYGSKISINAMLGHFSGMADYDFISGGSGGEVDKGMNLKSVAGGPFRLGNEDYLTINEFYDVVKQAQLRHEPNTKWTYSNLAYFLLSMLVEEVSGETIREYADKRIFKPLEMHNTFFSDNPIEIVKNRASGYKPNDEGNYDTDMTNLFWVGDGGIHTTVEDMLKWDQNFYSPKIGKTPQKLLKLFNTPNSDMETMRGGVYANGQMISEMLGKKSFSHGGGWLGVRTFYQRFPDEQFSTVILCNDTAQKPWEHAQKIAEFYFNGTTKTTKK